MKNTAKTNTTNTTATKRMTRFQQELSGALGEFWTKHAKEEIAKMQARVDNHEICTNMNGAAFWNSNGRYLMDDVAEKLAYTDFPFSVEETAKARKAQNELFFENYKKNYQGPSEEELAEMRAAFGPGETIVDVITGQRISL